MQIDPFLLEPVCQLLKCEDRIHRAKHPFIADGFLLLCNTGPQKNDFDIRPVNLLNIPAMRHHWGHNRRHQLCAVRIVFFDQVVHTRAACSDDIRHFILTDQFFIFVCHQRGSLCSLAHFPEPQTLKSIHYLSRRVEFKHTCIRRGNRYDRLKSLTKITLHPLHVAGKSLRILRTDLQAAAAVDTVVHHDPGLLVLD